MEFQDFSSNGHFDYPNPKLYLIFIFVNKSTSGGKELDQVSSLPNGYL